ncbi:GNAT family N-acetyltransferase [Xenorhabdus sp. XENO-10]|uniref:GNAT family N-acetyltransferase n=1 Tax=Xenorhabdus yunnanensis TaxID=3025878 RepID=A0ABT5LDP4_9GAMM|nr:GNAT family N-acetyltransferase [Xenorhabdus yunnanensis]MDC9588663.1 GNAT family N-acetyltransferase [Xenorhabdus yunnanensis]
MLKRTASFNSYIHKTPSYSLSRSKSFHSLPPDNILKINVNYQNPRLINGYVPVIRETNIEKGIIAVNQIYQSIKTDGWISHISNTGDISDITKREKEIYKKQEKTREDLWNMRCCITYNLLNKMQKLLNLLKKMGDTQNHTCFVCYNNTKPTGVILIRKYHSQHSRVKAYYPEIIYLITHPGIQNCAYLLMEKAVNISYQMGYHGKLKLTIATDELSPKVYEKMGFIKMKEPDNMKMTLDPNGNKAWIFSPSHGGYRFTGTY